jgi:hypothetical protein
MGAFPKELFSNNSTVNLTTLNGLGGAGARAAPCEKGSCGPLHSWSERRTIHIGGRALSILQWWVT